MNAETDPDGDRMLFLSEQDAVAAQCLTLCRYAGSLSDRGRSVALEMLSDGDPDVSGLESTDRRFAAVLRATLGMQEGSEGMHRSPLP